MQALACEVVRAFTKLGIAIAAKRPIMATTIMISTKVKPDLFDVLICILTLPFRCCGVNFVQQADLRSVRFCVHELPAAAARWVGSTIDTISEEDKPRSKEINTRIRFNSGYVMI